MQSFSLEKGQRTVRVRVENGKSEGGMLRPVQHHLAQLGKALAESCFLSKAMTGLAENRFQDLVFRVSMIYEKCVVSEVASHENILSGAHARSY